MEVIAFLLALLSSTSHLWSAPPSPAFAVVGAVVDEKGKPIAGARVEMVRLGSGPEGGAHTAETDGKGRFRIPDLPLTRFELTIGSPEHAPLVKKGIAAPPGAPTLDLGKLNLKRRGLISGQVVDPQGRPVQSVEVWPRSRDTLSIPKAAASTGPDGRFELRQYVLRDDEDLFICRPGYVSQWVLNEEISSQPLRIVLAPAVAVSGRVVDAEGKPVEGASFMTTFSGSNLSIGGPATSPCPSGKLKVTGADGGFTLELEKAGWFQLKTTVSGHFSTTLERLHVPAEGLKGLEIQLGKGAVVSGRVRDPKGFPIPGAQIKLSGGQESGTAVSDADGSYTLNGVEPGERELSVYHPDHAQGEKNVQVPAEGKRLDIVLHPRPRLEVRGRVLGPDGAPVAGAHVVDVFETETWTAADGSFVLKVDKLSGQWIRAEKEGFGPGFLFLPSGEPDTPVVEIRLTRGTTLTGRLLGVNPEAFPWARISLYCPSYPGVEDATVDSDGVFRIFDLPPGQCKVTALADGQTAAVSVDLHGDSSDVIQDIRFAPTHEVQGRVTGPDGEPVPGAGVDLIQQGGGAMETTTDENGFFSVRVEDGAYVATAVADGYQRTDAEQPVVVDGGPVGGVEIRLRREAVLTGRFPGLRPGEAIPSLRVDGPGRHWYYSARSEADQEGGYRITNLGPGEWTVSAEIQARVNGVDLTRTATGGVTIPEGATEARRDLDFHLGDLTLTVRFAEPSIPFSLDLRLPNGSTLVSSQDKPRDGHVQIPRLRAGSYHLRILSEGGTPLLDEPVHLPADQEIVLSLPAGQQTKEAN